jgi:hypothetical protein
MNEPDLRRACAKSAMKWAEELSRRLSFDDSWRILFAATISVMQAELTPPQIADTLRLAAEKIEAGHLDQPSKH